MGLLKTAAAVAVASSVHGRIQRRQQARWAPQNQAPAGVPTPPPPPRYAAPAQQACTEPVPPQAPAVPAPPADMNDRLAQLKQVDHAIPGCQPPMPYRCYGLV